MQEGTIISPEINNNDPNQEMAEVVQFLDENKGAEAKLYSAPTDYQRCDAYDENSSLANFLKRPVRISTFTWLESDAIGVRVSQILTPWFSFFNDSRIKNKLNNYAFIRCNLRIKIIVNASPFYYGAMMASYQPLTELNPNTIFGSSTNTSALISHSQRPHVWIYPQNNEGAEMTLPFFYHKDWLRTASQNDFVTMGTLSFINYTQLASANGITGTGVTVQVYAWAEDVIVSGPTLGLALTQSTMKSKDEYKVSGIASAVAAAFGALKNVPVIGPYATVSQIGATALASGARILGFTNVPVINDIMPYKPVTNPAFSTSEIAFPIEKLTLDPKNELSIDPKIVGLTSEDELDMKHLISRESYLTNMTWSTTNAVDDILFYSPISPNQFFNTSNIALTPASTAFYQTPLCWLSGMFSHWRGDIIIRFRVISSQYHKGRLRISFDPAGYTTPAQNIVADNVSTSVIYNSIIDIGKDSNVEMRIPYNQALPWLQSRVKSSVSWSTSLTPSFVIADNDNNGSITVRCLTTLTAPVLSSSIQILVSVRGAENLEFSNPANFYSENASLFNSGSRYSLLPPQSSMMGDYDPTGVSEILIVGKQSDVCSTRYLSNFGEAIDNLRQVLRRTSLVNVINYIDNIDPLVNTAIIGYASGRLPQTFGYDNFGIDVAKNQAGLVNKQFNFAKLHPITYISTAYVGFRGAVNWTLNVEPGNSGSVRVYRNPKLNSTGTYSTISAYSVATTTSAANSFYTNFCAGGTGGSALTIQKNQAGLSFVAPHYSGTLFQSTNVISLNNSISAQSVTNDEYQLNYHVVEVSSTPVSSPMADNRIWRYAAVGTDFTCHFFLNVPTLFLYGTAPVPV